MRGKIVWAKKATASEKTSLENDSQKCERVHHFISGVALVSSFHFEVGLQSPCPTLQQRQKRPTFSAEERVVLSLQCSMCANFAFFVGLFLKGMRAIMGNSFLGTHCHHSGSHTTSWSHFCAGKASRQRAMGYILPLAQSADFYPRHSTKQKFKDPPIFTFTPNTSQSVDAKRNWPLWEEKQPQLNSQFTPGDMTNIQ